MRIPKDKILEMVEQQRNSDQVDEAKQELPDQVDTDQHADCSRNSVSIRRSCSPRSAATSPGCEQFEVSGGPFCVSLAAQRHGRPCSTRSSGSFSSTRST
jgi:hypothetical protein